MGTVVFAGDAKADGQLWAAGRARLPAPPLLCRAGSCSTLLSSLDISPPSFLLPSTPLLLLGSALPRPRDWGEGWGVVVFQVPVPALPWNEGSWVCHTHPPPYLFQWGLWMEHKSGPRVQRLASGRGGRLFLTALGTCLCVCWIVCWAVCVGGGVGYVWIWSIPICLCIPIKDRCPHPVCVVCMCVLGCVCVCVCWSVCWCMCVLVCVLLRVLVCVVFSCSVWS